MSQISLCMIAKNEEKNIARALLSVRGLVDELIVVDTGSSDNTKKIAKSFGGKVYDFEWCDDFSAARNFSLSKAKCPWILVLDADEAISPKDHLRIKQLINDKNSFGFELIQRNYVNNDTINGAIPCDGAYEEERDHKAFLQVPVIRLFRNDPRIRFQGAVHELVFHSFKKHGLPWKHTDIPIHHFGYAVSGNSPSKLSFYYSLGKAKLKEQETDFKTYYELGVNCALRGDTDGALKFLKESVRLNARFHQSQMMLGTIYMNKGDLNSAITHLKKAVELNPSDYGALNNLGSTYRKLGQPDKAESYIRVGLSVNPSNSTLLYNLGLVKKDLFDFEEAEKAFRKAISLSNDPEKGLLELAEIYCITNREPEAKEILEPMAKRSQRASNLLALLEKPPKTISLCMIVKNEEGNLRELLSGVKVLFDEIIIADTGSTDNSIQVARELGARVFEFKWCDDFAAARNFSISKATSDYIFWLDADDRMDQQNINRFLALKWKLRAEKDPLALLFTICSALEQGRSQSIFQQLRLFPNVSGVKFEGRIHEQVFPSLHRLGIPIRSVDINIVHTGYNEPAKKAKKIQRNLKILEKNLENPFSCINRASLLKSLGRRDEARQCLEKALQSEGTLKKHTGWFEKAVSDLARLYIQEQETEKAKALLQRALRQSSDSFILLIAMGELLYCLGDCAGAEPFLLKATAIPLQPGPIPMQIPLEKSRAFTLLGHCYLGMNRLAEAWEAYKEALRYVESNHEARKGIRRVCARFEEQGNFAMALKAIETLPPPVEIEDQVMGLCNSLLAGMQERFIQYAEGILSHLNLSTDLEIASLEDLISLLSTIAQRLPKEPPSIPSIERIHDAIHALMECDSQPSHPARLS